MRNEDFKFIEEIIDRFFPGFRTAKFRKQFSAEFWIKISPEKPPAK
jgi:hypothetical protein